MPCSLKRLLLAAFAVEGSLAALSFLWAARRGLSFGVFSTEYALIGFASTAPLFALLVATDHARDRQFLRPMTEFRRIFLEPIALALGWRSALLLSVLAGVGEELFFRGILQQEVGLILSSLLFAVLHFGTALRKFLTVATVYFAVSLYLGLLYSFTGSVWSPMIAHILYDFIALLYIRWAVNEQSDTRA